MELSNSRARLVIPNSARGRMGIDGVNLAASMSPLDLPSFGPRHVTDLARVNADIPRAEQLVAETHGEAKPEARRFLKDMIEERNALVDRRDKAVRSLMAAFDPKVANRRFSNSFFNNALLTQGDPASVAKRRLCFDL
jgi:hypothetical protein